MTNFLLARDSLKWNAMANLTGRLWASLLSAVAVPIFIKFLGTEAFGLIGLFATLQTIFAFLDLGLAATVTREVAQNIAQCKPAKENATLLRTFETIYWVIAFVLGSVILAASNWIAVHWVNIQRLSSHDVRLAIMIMALSFAARWPISLYTGVLQGVQAQVLQNTIYVLAATLRTMGALAAIAWLAPTIVTFLAVQAIANVFEISASMWLAWRMLGRQTKGRVRIDFGILRRVWRFAMSFNAMGIFGMFASNADRLIISKFLPLEHLGYYSVASTATGAMPLVNNAISVAAFPRFAAQASMGGVHSLSHTFHRSVQAIAFPSIAFSSALVFFSFPILRLWTRSLDIAQETFAVLMILALASLLNSLQSPAFQVLVAHGHTGVPLAVNASNVVVFVPVLLLTIVRYGITAAAIVWFAQNLVFLSVYGYWVQRKILKEPAGILVRRDILPYVVLGVFWFGAMRLLVGGNQKDLIVILAVAAAMLGYGLTTILWARFQGIFPSGMHIPFFFRRPPVGKDACAN